MPTSLPPPPLPPPKLISQRFSTYDKSIRDIWESYHLQFFYFELIHQQIKKGKISPLTLPHFGSKGPTKELTRKDTLGAISHTTSKVTPQRSIISAVAESESFLQYLYIRVLRDYPNRLLSGAQSESASREEKIIDIVLTSDDKWEMLNRIIEERVRSLFYGPPGEFFLKDKAKLGFGDFFAKNCVTSVERYIELCARRNILIHNEGRVDRKYLREVPSTTLKHGEKVVIDEEYLQRSLLTLRGLCATAGVLVCEKIYADKVPSTSVMLKRKKASLI